MKDNREQYEQLSDRAGRLLAAVANEIMKANPEKLKGMEGNVARLLMCVLYTFIPPRQPDAVKQHATGDKIVYRGAPSLS
jgi:hypothetical protein